nr:hypothetical protein [Asgard group archaeon]
MFFVFAIVSIHYNFGLSIFFIILAGILLGLFATKKGGLVIGGVIAIFLSVLLPIIHIITVYLVINGNINLEDIAWTIIFRPLFNAFFILTIPLAIAMYLIIGLVYFGFVSLGILLNRLIIKHSKGRGGLEEQIYGKIVLEKNPQ